MVAVIGSILAIGFFNTTLRSLATPHSFSIVNDPLSISRETYYYVTFSLPPNAVLIQVNGTFAAYGGSIRAFVMDQTDYQSWKNGQTASSYHDSGQTTCGTLTVPLPNAGTYDLVYSNIYGGNDTIYTTATAYYRG